jgi:hypothetical protein
MASVSAKVFSHHQKNDGTYNVKIIVSHKKVRRYLETCHWVSQRQLDRDLKIKHPILNKIINKTLDDIFSVRINYAQKIVLGLQTVDTYRSGSF